MVDLGQTQKFEYEFSQSISYGSFRQKQLMEQIKNRKRDKSPKNSSSNAVDDENVGIDDTEYANSLEFGYDKDIEKRLQESDLGGDHPDDSYHRNNPFNYPNTPSYDKAEIRDPASENFEVYQTNVVPLKQRRQQQKKRKAIISPKTKEDVSKKVNYFAEAVGEDWVCLALISIITALIGLFQDYVVTQLFTLRKILARATEHHGFLQYVVWTIYMLLLVNIAVAFTFRMSPAGAGSGIPELKTVLKGITLKGFFTFRTLLAKVGGLIIVVGTGLPIGREGPLCHSASIVGDLLMSKIPIFHKIFANESRRLEILAAACAMGVAATNGAPIGGVLFTIEVTATYFAVRNYWRGFFAAIVGAFVAQIIRPAMFKGDTIAALFPTSFRQHPYSIGEMMAFIALGAFCGLTGALFILLNRKIVETRRDYSKPGMPLHFLEKSRYIYPSLIVVVVAVLTFPRGIGPWMSGTVGTDVSNLLVPYPMSCIPEWSDINVFLALVVFVFLKFLFTCFSMTVPTPTGVWICTFAVGCGIGRFFGEVMRAWFPRGVEGRGIFEASNETCVPEYYVDHLVIPGGYAFVGGAALCAGVTHTISSGIIALELTGQLEYLLPVMISVIVAIHICQRLSPSFYDNLIQLKSLPYLPDLRRGESYNLMVSDFMNRNLLYISLESSFYRVARVLNESNLLTFPVVDNPETCVLLGSIQRHVLQELFDQQMRRPVPTTPKGTRKVISLESDLPIKSDSSSTSEPPKPPLQLQGLFKPPTPTLRVFDDDEDSNQVFDSPSTSLQNLSPINTLSEIPESSPPGSPQNQPKPSNGDAPTSNRHEPASLDPQEDPSTKTMTHQQSGALSENYDDKPKEDVQFETIIFKRAPKLQSSSSSEHLEVPKQVVGSRFTMTTVPIPKTEDTHHPTLGNSDGSSLTTKPGGKQSTKNSFIPIDNKANSDDINNRVTLSTPDELATPDSFSGTPGTPTPSHSGDATPTNETPTSSQFNSVSSNIVVLPPNPWGDVIHMDSDGNVVKVVHASRTSNRGMGLIPHRPGDKIDETWRKRLLREKIDLRAVEIDPAPFQLVERTSLYKVHTLFNMLGLSIAYVTSVGRLVGIVGLKEIRGAVEKFGGVRSFEKSYAKKTH